MDGRRDVDLDSAWSTGGGPAGRLDQQAVEEIAVPLRRANEVNC